MEVAVSEIVHTHESVGEVHSNKGDGMAGGVGGTV